VRKLAEKLSKQRDITVDYRIVKGAPHLFTDRLDKLSAQVDDYISAATKPAPKAGKEKEPKEKDKPKTLAR
jgi:alpha/beta superfamily hydrolase